MVVMVVIKEFLNEKLSKQIINTTVSVVSE